MLHPDPELIKRFELQLDPLRIESSPVKARLIGFGEISSIIELEDLPGVVLKRMPMFSNERQAEEYLEKYKKYCALLTTAGVNLPEDGAVIVGKSPQLTVLYFAQEKLDTSCVGNRLIHTLSEDEISELVKRVLSAIYGVWDFNKKHPGNEIAIDSQISNWALLKASDKLVYLDTSTPLFRINHHEQMDPELILTSAPSFGRAIIRRFFLKDILDRYYDEKAVNTDLVANLYKEQKPELIPLFLDAVNRFSNDKLTAKEIADYYREDKFIWQLFLALRKIDRFLHKYVYRKQYQFILPGKIKR
ncbi:MAG: DUF6206 family protein [Saprospiraceae bacterium]